MSMTKQELLDYFKHAYEKARRNAGELSPHGTTDRTYIAFAADSPIGQALKQLLKQPTLPEEPTEEMLREMHYAFYKDRYNEMTNGDDYRREYKALYAALSTPPAPKTKRVKVWRVEWWDTFHRCVFGRNFDILDHAHKQQANLQSLEKEGRVTCINLIEDTQEVPDND